MPYGITRNIQYVISLSANGEILKSIGKGLDTFGSDVTQAIYWRLEKEYKMKREDIVVRPDAFSEILDKMFGPGATAVKSAIMREIKQDFDGLGSTDHSLAGLVKEARSYLHRMEAD